MTCSRTKVESPHAVFRFELELSRRAARRTLELRLGSLSEDALSGIARESPPAGAKLASQRFHREQRFQFRPALSSALADPIECEAFHVQTTMPAAKSKCNLQLEYKTCDYSTFP